MGGARTATAILGTGVALAGCATTQQEAARLQLNSARIRASEVATIVRDPGAAVHVTGLSVIAPRTRATFVVTVHNSGTTTVADLPISVGVHLPHGRTTYLNARPSGEFVYFDAHLPFIAASGTLTWVYTAGRALPRGGRPFALIGARQSPTVRTGHTAPVIRARLASHPSAGATLLAVSLHNTTSLPQYQLQVYAVARRSGHVLAAGGVTVPHLGADHTEAVTVPVAGPAGGAHFDVVALPTIFQ